MSFNLHLSRKSPRDLRTRLPEHDCAWIAANRRPFDDYAVASLVPAVFERYARILHPAWTTDDEPIRWDAVAAWSNRTIHALAQWEYICLPLGDPPTAAPFATAPREGSLPPHQLAALCALLAAHTVTPEQCFVGLWEGYGGIKQTPWDRAPVLVLDQRTFVVRRGSIELAQAVGRPTWNSPSPEGPTIFWPADRAWFVASDPDLDSTYVGGSQPLITALRAGADLEAWPAGPADLVTVVSDQINAP